MCIAGRGRRRFTSLSLSAAHLAKRSSVGSAAHAEQGCPASRSLSESRYVQGSSADALTSNGGKKSDGAGFNDVAPKPRTDDAYAGVDYVPSAILPAASPASAVSDKQQQQQPLQGTYVQGVYVPPPKPQPKRIRKPQKPGKTAKLNERHFVKHDYHDHADDVDDEEEPSADEVAAAVLGQSQCGGKKKRKGGSVSFPRKLHFLLDQIEADGLAHVISWLPHGRAFAVHKPKEFVENVMPKYFKQTKLTSFQRQLNLYGFSRLTRGRDNGGYYNEYFLRGKPFLTKNMVRTRVKGTKFKAASSPDQEPNFYSMKPVSLPNNALSHFIFEHQATVVSEDDKASSASASGASLASSEENDQCAKPNFSAPVPPPIVTVPSFDDVKEGTWLAPNAPLSPIRCNGMAKENAARPTEHILEHMATIPEPSSPCLAPMTPPQVGRNQQSRNLWDFLDPFTPTPVPPNLNRTIPEEAQWQPPTPAAAMHGGAAMGHPAIVTAPPSRSDSRSLPVERSPGTTGTTEIFDKDTLEDFLSTLRATPSAPSAPTNPDNAEADDPLMDLVHDWVSGDAFSLEQAAANDVDFGRMLEMIAE